jgi:hypothetical protein
VEIQIVSSSQVSTPWIVHDHCRAELGRLHDGLDFAAVSHSLSSSLSQKKIDCASLITVATFKEDIRIKERPKPIFSAATLEEIFSNSLGDEHT